MLPLSKRWTDEELEKLKRLSAAGCTVVKASAALRRNRSAVSAKARELGMPLRTIAEVRKAQRHREFSITGKNQGRWNSI